MMKYVKGGEYAQSPIFNHLGSKFWQLKDKTFGIIGMGAIGTRVASIAEAFGARIQYFSTSGKNRNPYYKRVQLEELLRTSDVVSIHAPLNEKTEDLIGYEQIKMMQEGAYLLNLGRGGIVNEEDLARALDESLLAGAALDVLVKEPIRADHPLLMLKEPSRIFITPHNSWMSVESRTQLISSVIDGIQTFIKKFQEEQD